MFKFNFMYIDSLDRTSISKSDHRQGRKEGVTRVKPSRINEMEKLKEEKLNRNSTGRFETFDKKTF